jgi:hypothetical protein
MLQILPSEVRIQNPTTTERKNVVMTIRQRLADAESDDSDLQRNLAVSLDRVGFALEDQGDDAKALD